MMARTDIPNPPINSQGMSNGTAIPKFRSMSLDTWSRSRTLMKHASFPTLIIERGGGGSVFTSHFRPRRSRECSPLKLKALARIRAPAFAWMSASKAAPSPAAQRRPRPAPEALQVGLRIAFPERPVL